MLSALPVDAFLGPITAALAERRAAVVVAAPGAGKTTRIPPALIADGPVILLQPRRVAARSIARRIAAERGWTPGREVGWHVRLDRQFSRDTRLLVATEGILTARLQQDPLLSDFRTIVLDEFHERSIHADLGLALARQAWRARDDIRILVMSATLDAREVSRFLNECPVIDVPGTLFPNDVTYRPGAGVAAAVRELLERTSGQVLCFLPGAAEVRRAAADVRSTSAGLDVVELHGSLPADEQDAALAPVSRRRVIVSTNIAETSLTVPGVTAVVDSGLHRVARYDPDRGVDSLDLERISQDAADQRAGRAARLAPGIVLRLWAETDRLRPHREPDIVRMDLSGTVLDILAWGGDPRTFEWFAPPSPDALEAAMQLLQALGAVEDGRLTPLGLRMSRIPLHPRLARIMLEAKGADDAAIACALLSDRQHQPRHPATSTCDLLPDPSIPLAPHVRRLASDLQRAAGAAADAAGERELRRALLAGYPDRVARRRSPGDRRLLLFSGHGAVVGDESGVRDGEFLLALDVSAGRRGEHSEARVRVASIVEKDWLQPTRIEATQTIGENGTVRATEREYCGAIVLRERPGHADAAAAAELLAAEFLRRPLGEPDQRIVNRAKFAGIDLDLPSIAVAAAAGRQSVADVRLEEGLDWAVRRRLDDLAPARLAVPSGRTHALDYRDDGTVSLPVKLQELFGLADSPRLGPRQEPVLLVLLAPNGRPVQTTRDLRSFWNTTYPEVRKELRGRYPRHPWPEDPWNATPTARTTRAIRRS